MSAQMKLGDVIKTKGAFLSHFTTVGFGTSVIPGFCNLST